MSSVSLRLNLLPEALAKLHTAIVDPSGKLKQFVRIKRTQRVGPFYEVDLNILDGYDTGHLCGTEPMKRVAVTREMVGELFDLLGLFPQAQQPHGQRHGLHAAIVEIKNLATPIIEHERIANSGLKASFEVNASENARGILSICMRIEDLLIKK